MVGTGYTYTIKDGICKTPKEFLKLCLKNFGCCIDLRDESLSKFNIDDFLKELKNESLSSSKYLVTSLSNAEKELEKVLNMTDNDWKKELESCINKTKKKLEESKAKHEEESKLLYYFTEAIKNWNCSSEYHNVKNFALEQLALTEAEDYEWDEKLLNELSNTTVKEYRNDRISSALKEVDYYKERIEDDKKLKDEKVKFIEGFLKEIEKV